MKYTILPLLAVTALAACDPAAPPPPDALPLLGGYRDPADQCQRVGESAATVEFLDDAADLVGCPEGAENIGVFVTETGGIEVGRLQGYILYSVPRR
jgi:hypothetical protein